MNYEIITLTNWGDWLPYNHLFYFEITFRRKINNYMLMHYNEINRKALKNGVLFLYLNGIKHNISLFESQIAESVSYNHPDWKEKDIKAWTKVFIHWIEEVENEKYYEQLESDIFDYNAYEPVYLFRRLDATKVILWPYTKFYDEKSGLANISEECYLDQESLIKKFADPVIHFDINPEPEQSSLYDVDSRFKVDGNRISNEIIERVNLLASNGLYGTLIETFLNIAEKCGLEIKYQPEIQSEPKPTSREIQPKPTRKTLGVDVNKLLQKACTKRWTDQVALSRLTVNQEYKIILADYNEIEVKLTPLPKALYLLFLRHPEGILLKHINDYRQELIEIYNRITNRTDQQEVDNSINALLDCTNNSINEKCSRIKEAFLNKLDDSIAKHYYITGERGMPKRVILPSDLIDSIN